MLFGGNIFLVSLISLVIHVCLVTLVCLVGLVTLEGPVSLEGLVTLVCLVGGHPGLSGHPCMSGHPGLSGGSGPISTLDQSRNQSSSSSVLMSQVDQDVHQINGKDSEGVFTRVGHADVSADSDAECEKSLVEMEF